MKDVVNSPRWWELELICHLQHFLDDFEGSMTFGVQLGLLMFHFEVGGFQPDLVSNLKLWWDLAL